LVSGALLLAPFSFIERFGLEEFVKYAKPWIGITFLLSASLLLIDILFSSYTYLMKQIKNNKVRKQRLDRLKKLTPEEKKLFLRYIYDDTRTQYFDLANGVARGLELEGFIFQSSNLGNPIEFAFNIQPWVWDLLKRTLIVILWKKMSRCTNLPYHHPA
jgi:hypothetical protein